MEIHLQLARIYGVIAAALGLMGILGSGHLFGITNTDPVMDMLRLGLAGILLYAGFVAKTYESAIAALLITGTIYFSMGLFGIIMPDLGALLPTGLTSFDITFHLIAGGLATLFGMQSREPYSIP